MEDIFKGIRDYNDLIKTNIIDFFEKGKKANVGDIRTHTDGKKYEKTSNGWIPVKGDKKEGKEEEGTEKTHTKKELQDHAQNTSEADLHKVIKENADPKLRKHAHEELARREKEEHVQEDKGETVKKKTNSVKESSSHEKLHTSLDSGKFKKLDRVNQSKLINDAQSQTSEIEKTLTQNFSDEEIDALDNYVSIAYKDINGYLRKDNPEKDEKIEKTIKLIDSAMKKNKLTEDIVVYRSLSGSGDMKQDKAFQSASIDPYGSYQFKRDGGKIHKLVIPKGTNYAYIGGGEKEILLPRDLDLSKFISK